MTKLEQAARQALVALEDVMADFDGSWTLADTAITALREALAEQSEQKPVLCVECGQPTMHMGNKCYSCCQKATRGLEDALKAAVPVRTKDHCNPLQDLTDDEIASLWASDGFYKTPTDFARAVIAADREKNK